jgi:hypothetical protein
LQRVQQVLALLGLIQSVFLRQSRRLRRSQRPRRRR